MIIYDTETTGLLNPDAANLDKQPKIIEFAAIKLDDQTLKEVGRIEFLCNPGEKLTPKIIEVTGITDDDLVDKPPFSAYYNDLVDFFIGERYLIAHNLSFDHGMLKNDLARMDKVTQFPWPPVHICTIEASYDIRGKRLRLGDLHTIATGKPHQNAHRAMGDVEALVNCVKWLIDDDFIKLDTKPKKVVKRAKK